MTTEQRCRSRAARRRCSAPLTRAALFCVLLAGTASAQRDTVEIDTSEGPIVIELSDHALVAAQAKYFRYVQPWLAKTFFHRGEKGADPTLQSLYLQASRFKVDPNAAIEELSTAFPRSLQTPPLWENTEFTVAWVREEATKQLTSEWIINVTDNPELDDPFGNDPTGFSEAYFVFGTVIFGQDIVRDIADLDSYDASADPDLLDLGISSGELEQVPVFDSFSGMPGDFINPCDPDDTVCRTPECVQPTPDDLACDDPRCIALIPLTPAEQAQVDMGNDVTRQCTEPALSSFPIVIPEPRGIVVQLGALLALGALGAFRRRRHARSDRAASTLPPLG